MVDLMVKNHAFLKSTHTGLARSLFPALTLSLRFDKGSTIIFRQLPVLTGMDSSDRKSDTIPRIRALTCGDHSYRISLRIRRSFFNTYQNHLGQNQFKCLWYNECITVMPLFNIRFLERTKRENRRNQESEANRRKNLVLVDFDPMSGL